jgi:hypothetical protein
MSPDLLIDRTAPEAGAQIMEALFEEALAVRLDVAPLAGAAAESLLRRAPWLAAWPCNEAWIADIPPPGLERRCSEAAYHQRRAERLGARIAIRTAEDPDEVGAGLEHLFDLHERRWRGRPDAVPRFGATAEMRQWYRSLIRAMACRREVRVVEICEDDQPVAGLLGLVVGHGALMHTTAAQPGAQLKRPGHAVLLAFVEEAQAAGATVLNLGGGAGDLGGPKADLYPSRVSRAGLYAARSWAIQQALELPLVVRARLARLRGR